MPLIATNKASQALLKAIRKYGEGIRDFYNSDTSAAELYIVDTEEQWGALGLDLIVHNLGAAPFTVSVDNHVALTIDAGAAFTLQGVVFTRVQVNNAGAIQFDIAYAGVKL